MAKSALAKLVLITISCITQIGQAYNLEESYGTKLVEVNPVGLAVGTLPISYSVMTNPRNYLGLKWVGTQANFENTKIEGFALSLLDTYALTGGIDHALFRGEIGGGRLSLRDSARYSGGREVTYASLRGLLGYGWGWSNGLRLTLAGGFGYINGRYKGEEKSSFKVAGTRMKVKDSKPFALVHPDAELALGYNF